MKTTNTIAEVRVSKNKLSATNGLFPVIVLTPYSAKKQQYGVQFWTPAMISIGTSVNTDGSVSKFIEIL